VRRNSTGRFASSSYNRPLVFEIGNSLREARLRQNLDFGAVEAGTKIRSKYLQALEAEGFEILPGDSYVKGFLRTYAEYLGLDGQLYVDEYNSRFATAEEQTAPSSSPRYRERHRVRDSNFVVVALAAIVAVTILVVVAFGFGNGEPSSDPSVPPEASGTPTQTTETGPATASGEESAGEKENGKADVAKLVLTASGGDSWLSVRSGGPQGEQIYTGTLEQGQRLPVTRKKIWLQIGQPAALEVTLNGFRIADFPSESGAVVVVTASGIRRAPTS
jgi:cytoskeleton protein RodZ